MKKTILKSLAAIFLCAALVLTVLMAFPAFSAFPVFMPAAQTAYAQEPETDWVDIPAAGTVLYDGRGTAYTVSDADYDSACVFYSKAPSKVSGTVEIPATVKLDGVEYTVNGIDEKAFYKKKKLTKVVIGSNVERIWNNAFEGCKGLKSVKMNKKIEIVDNYAFQGCTSLKKITIPDTVWYIGYGAFCGCKALKTVKMGEGIKEISDGAFEKCSKLKSIVIPGKVKVIGTEAFSKCKSLKKITIHSKKLKKKNIGDDAFLGISAKAVFKCPAEKSAAYKKIFLKRGAKKTCKFK